MKKKILFIEDDAALQRAMGDMLRAEGYDIQQALNGDIGLRLAESGKPNLILLDLVLPQKDGFEVLAALHENMATRAIPVIVLTNMEGSEEIGKVLSLGARAYLVKTHYTLEELLVKVKKIIGE
jgi:DNA-binding response OmpR family regulator